MRVRAAGRLARNVRALAGGDPAGEWSRSQPGGDRPALDRPLQFALLSGGLLTLVVTVSPLVRFAYDNLSLHVALETGEGLIGGLLAYLAVQRFRAKGNTRDAVLAWTFTVLAVTNLVLSAVPVVALGSRPGGTLTWAVAGLRLCGAAGLCAAAYVHRAERPTAGRVLPWLVWGTGAVAVVVAASAYGAGTFLADAVDPFLSPEASGRPRVVGHPVVLTIQVLAMALFAAAAVGFKRQERGGGDELLRWLAAGAVLAAFARLNFFLFPSLYSNWVYTGDVLRLGSYLCFLVGAGREIDAYRRDQTRLAVVEERRRMARDLHDGLVQELSFIRSQAAAMAGGVHVADMASHLAAAADRALQESRRAVEALSGTGPGSVADALRQAAEEVAERAGTSVSLTGEVGGRVPAGVRDALVRIVREATTNAVRHGHASSVSIRVDHQGSALVLAVADDGRGFDPRLAAGSGFGLRSMRERAENLGGSLAVRSEPGLGAEVTLTVPCRTPMGERGDR